MYIGFVTTKPLTERCFTALAFILPFCLYLITLCRGIPIGDAPELALAAARLQIAHPPGYPLLTVVGRIWSEAFFFLRPIVALNLLSAVFATSACGMLYILLSRFASGRGNVILSVALAVTVSFAASRTMWATATGFEVYALAALFAIAITLSLIRFVQIGECRYILFSAYLLGLSLCNHLSLLALLPALAIAAFSMRAILKLRTALVATALCVFPGTLYAYLMIRAKSDLVMSWYNPQRLTGLKQQMFAETYQRFVVSPNPAEVVPYLHRLGNQLGGELVLPLIVLALGGLVVQFRRESTVAFILGSIVLANCALNFSYTISDIAPYFLPTIIVAMIWIFELLSWIGAKSRIAAVLAAAIALAITAVAVVGNYDRSDLSDRTNSELYAKDLFDNVPTGGVLFCGSDNSMFPTLYLRYVEDFRSDCSVYGHLPTMSYLQRELGYQFEGDWTNFPDLLRHAIDSGSRPVVMARELMNFDNNFPRILDNLYAQDLVYSADSTMNIPRVQRRVDIESLPALYDPKEALMYTVYVLTAAESAMSRDHAEADRLFSRAIRLVNSMNDPALSSSLAAYFADREEQRHTIAVIEPALRLLTLRRSERLQLLGGLGTAQLRLQNEAAARSAFNQMLALDTGSIEARFQLMTLDASDAIKNSNLPAAISIYERMAQLAPDQHQVTLQLAILYMRVGNIDSARMSLQRCIDVNYRREEASALMQQLK